VNYPSFVATPPGTPTLYRESTAFRMKASYQRNMLCGLAVAVVLVTLPAVMASFWPVTDVPVVISSEVMRETVRFDWGGEVRVIPGEHVGPSGPPSGSNNAGLFIDDLIITADPFDQTDNSELGGRGAGSRHAGAPDSDAGWNWPGEEGRVYVPDTQVYRFQSTELTRIPVLIAMDQPIYPPLAHRAGIEGKVILWVLVDRQGRPSEVQIHDESNPGYGFGEYAARAVEKAVFSPAIANRQPVRCWVSIPVVFRLE